MDPHPDPAEAYEQIWEREVLHDGLERLRHDVAGDTDAELSYLVLHLRLVERLSTSAVAAQLQLDPDQVRYRYHRMKQRLYGILSAFAGDQFVTN